MASNRKDFSFEGRIRPTEGCKQKYFKQKFIKGVIISCITKRKFSVYKAIEKLCTECVSQCCKPAIEIQDTAKTIQESQSELIAGVHRSWASCAIC